MDALVIPTIREKNIKEFLDHWGHALNLEVFVVEDNPTKQFDLGLEHHYSWKEIDESLGENSWIISRRDSAIRSFGFLMAYRAEAQYIYTLDDDCLPANPKADYFVAEHLEAINFNPRWTESYPGRRTRGIPYRNRGQIKDPVLNMGLWKGHPDLDSVQTLNGEVSKWVHEDHPTRIMPIGQYFPLCGMNMCFRRQITPLMYFPLMGEGVPYRRFDDIWCGIIMKKICDYLGDFVTCGPPYINHTRASDPFVNLVKEAPGIAANETFWETIDKIPLSGDSYIECMIEIGQGLELEKDQYLQKLGKAIIVWARLFF
jgi:reversibly glycosylated polypeptide/UDP-arabinopyranose mutase